jgi:type 1 fimbria pilin
MKDAIKKTIRLILLGLIAATAVKPGSASAACNLATSLQRYFVTQGKADVYVDSGLAPGTSLGRHGEPDLRVLKFKCTGVSNPVFIKTNIAQGAMTSGDLYELTVGGQRSGVGVRLSMSINGGDFLPMPIERSLTLPEGDPAYTESYVVDAELVRTSSPVVYGQVDQNLGIGGSNFYNGTGPVGPAGQYLTIYTGTPLVLARPACSMDIGSLNQTVELGRYTTAALQDPGSTTPWVPFKLTMANCGDPDILVDITFGSNTDQDQSNSNLFGLRSGDPSGLGIALSTDDGSDKVMQPGVTATFPGKLSGDSYNFRARLERTQVALTAGRFDRPVTVLVNYR